MGFSAKQVRALKRSPDHRHIRRRQAHGRELTYLEGWYAISEANRIFGFDSWNRETVETKCVLARENRGTFIAVYVARVRLTVHADGATIVREGHGSGEGRGDSPGEVHDIAVKAAETDATKRALATFGRPFGLALYSSLAARPAVVAGTKAAAPAQLSHHRAALPPDDTTPIPRPSRYYGRRQDMVTRDRAQARRHIETVSPAAAPLVPSPPATLPGKIDKSALALAEPRRIRDRIHLRFVAAQPCLVCGRQPCDPHHLRFAQPRAIGLKVSDEFTVPLCRGHHRELHRHGDEKVWWDKQRLEPMGAALQLWRQSRPLPAEPAKLAPSEQSPQNEPATNSADQDVASTSQTDETKPIVPSASS